MTSTFEYLPGVDSQIRLATRLQGGSIHLTHNVYGGRMKNTGRTIYEKLFNFPRNPYFRHQARIHRPHLQALTRLTAKIRIPLNEGRRRRQGPDSKEFRASSTRLRAIQHIASFICDDLRRLLGPLKKTRRAFMTPPRNYYKMLDERLPGHGQPVGRAPDARAFYRLTARLKAAQPRLLFARSSAGQVGPVFSEFIQRKGDYKGRLWRSKLQGPCFESMGATRLSACVFEGRGEGLIGRASTSRASTTSAYRCKGCEGNGSSSTTMSSAMDFQLAIAEDHVPSTGAYDP